MNGQESERPELYDFETAKGLLFGAINGGQAELVVDLLENGPKDLRLLTIHIFRMAFKNNDINMIMTLMSFGKERDSESRITIMEDAVKTDSGEIIRTVYAGLGISNEMLKPKLLAKIEKYLSAADASSPTQMISESSFLQLLAAGNVPEIIAAIDQIEEINAVIVEAVMKTQNDDIITELALHISLGEFTIEHRAMFDWLKANHPDPDLAKLLDDIVNGVER